MEMLNVPRIHYVCHLDMRVPGSDVLRLFAPPDLPVVEKFTYN